MKAENEENLRELFEKFLNSKEANEALEDIRKGEEILGEYRAPEPGKELVAEIKAEVGGALAGRKANAFKQTAYKIAAAAAGFIILAAIGVKLFESGSGRSGLVTASIIPRAIWDSNDIGADDEDLAILAAEIEQVEGEVLAVQLGEDGGNGGKELAELEMEMIEIDSDFWKG